LAPLGNLFAPCGVLSW